MSDRPTDKDIEDVLDWANQQIAKGGSRFHGMTYEEGVDATIRWMQGDSDDRPDAE